MPYNVLIDTSNVYDLQNFTPAVDELPPGTVVTITADINMAANIASMFVIPNSMDWWANKLAPADIKVTDVQANFQGHYVITGVVQGSPTLVLIAVLAGIFAVVGIAWAVQRIMVSYYIAEATQAKTEMVKELAQKGYSADDIAKILEKTDTVVAPQSLLGRDYDWILPVALGLGALLVINNLRK